MQEQQLNMKTQERNRYRLDIEKSKEGTYWIISFMNLNNGNRWIIEQSEDFQDIKNTYKSITNEELQTK